MFWGWNFEIEIWNWNWNWNWNCLLLFPFFGMLIWKLRLHFVWMIFFVLVFSLIYLFHFCIFSFLFVIHFSLLCLFFSLCYSLCLLPFSGMSFVFECWFGHGRDWNLPMVMNRLGLPGVEISVLWGSVLMMSQKYFRDPSVMARLKVMSDLALDLNGSSCLSRS